MADVESDSQKVVDAAPATAVTAVVASAGSAAGEAATPTVAETPVPDRQERYA